jgi:hypothetical protein
VERRADLGQRRELRGREMPCHYVRAYPTAEEIGVHLALPEKAAKIVL